MERSKKLMVSCIVMASLAAAAMATMADDEKDCADQLTSLAACIPFVSGTAKKPSPQCCEDTQKVKTTKPKCLCVLIKESTDPSMGLPVNTTLALQMPSACNIDAKVSDCPCNFSYFILLSSMHPIGFSILLFLPFDMACHISMLFDLVTYN